jgi:DNA modification methylase
MTPYYQDESVTIYHGDCRDILPYLPEVDLVLTDPPYEIGFMGKIWDSTGIAYNVEMWKECLGTLKPGGHLLAFGGTRTYHRMACAIEDAGFEVRDMIEWVYGSGFPKSLNIGKVIDKFLKTGNASWNGTGDSSNGALGYSKLQHQQGYRPADYSNKHQDKSEITEDKAKQWEGWGTALKPAHEPICMARKPLSEKTVAENCLKYGTGGINIDESRVSGIHWKAHTAPGLGSVKFFTEGDTPEIEKKPHKLGRFPANLVLEDCEEVRECFPESKSGAIKAGQPSGTNFSISGELNKRPVQPKDIEASSGNASRFFKSIVYQAKASKKDRGEGNIHATVKPTGLIKYLISMTTRFGQTVLDPFAGSGTTGKACKVLSRKCVLIELEEKYCEIAAKRMRQGVLC